MTMLKTATISDDRKYRYRLTRFWGPGLHLPFVMLNPSTADSSEDDPTIRRCMSFARREGFGGIEVVNLHAFRATRPQDLKFAEDPVGSDNVKHLVDTAMDSITHNTPLVCAWGASGGLFAMDRKVLNIFGALRAKTVCLGETVNGSPRHPLYVRDDQPMVPYNFDLQAAA